ncbi:MAG: GerMN domain-containing protein [Vicinamibacterales bacterium]
MTRRLLLVTGLLVAVVGLGVLWWWNARPAPPSISSADVATPAPVEAPEPVGHITATLYYLAEDGAQLVAVRQDVPLAEGGLAAQGRELVRAQLAAPLDPQRSPIPAGTALRAFYVTARGDAFVDLSADVSTGHPGGSLGELLTVAALVNVVTTNLPAVRRVQILIEGQEVDTLAGHVDLRRPLPQDLSLVRGES